MKYAALLAASLIALTACGGTETPAPATPVADATAPGTPAVATPAATSETLTSQGWGPLKIGMTKHECSPPSATSVILMLPAFPATASNTSQRTRPNFSGS